MTENVEMPLKQNAGDSLEEMWLRTVPICIFDGAVGRSRLVELGTAILLRIKSRHFLLSAGHCVRNSNNRNNRLTLGVKKKAPPRIPQIVNSYYCCEDGTEVDFGFWELADYDASLIKERHVFLTLDRVDVITEDKCSTLNDWMLLAGYPGEMPPSGVRNITAKILGYTTKLGSKEQFSSIPRKHLEINLLDLYVPAKGIILPTSEDNEHVDIPDFSGCSGGGVWQSGANADKSEWSPSNMNLVAIYIGNWPLNNVEQKDRLARAVLVGHHLNLIAHHYHDLKEEIRERFPDIDSFRCDY